MEDPQEQTNNRPWLFKPGQSGNPGGRPKGSKSLKTFVQEMIRDMSDEEKLEYLGGLDKKVIWEMGEGKPESKSDITSGGEKLDVILVEFLDAKNHTDSKGVSEAL